MFRSSRGRWLGLSALVALCLGVGAVPALAAPATPAPNSPGRDYGTPTATANKICPFTGQIPVTIPPVGTPTGTSLPGTAGGSLPVAAVPSHVRGELCMSPRALAEAKQGRPPAVLLLVEGVTYGTFYWDFPLQPATYSAVNALTSRDYATLNIDRIGQGRSDHPAGALTTTAAQADIVHQLVTKLRAGAIGGVPFKNVTTVGHSFGSAVVLFEAAQHNDTDAVIVTGYTNRVGAINVSALVTTSGPPSLDPVTASEPWAKDPLYLQPRPGSRNQPALYYAPNADPAVIAKDQELANTITLTEVATFAPPEYSGIYKNINVPVFAVAGELDTLVCGANQQECSTDATQASSPQELEAASNRLRNWEAPAYNSAACFRAAVIPDAGHDVNLHRNAQQTFAQIAYFADAASGPDGSKVTSYRASCRTQAPGVGDLLPETGRLVPPFPIDGIGPLGDPMPKN